MLALLFELPTNLEVFQWLYHPKSDKPPAFANTIVEAFESAANQIDSEENTLPSNDVLAAITPMLLDAGFQVETGKKASGKIHVPVLFGLNGKLEKTFEADAYHKENDIVLEVEAWRGVTNNQFLKDLFQACMMHDMFYLGIAIRNTYRGSQNFDTVVRLFDAMYSSNRLQLPLKGILVIGY